MIVMTLYCYNCTKELKMEDRRQVSSVPISLDVGKPTDIVHLYAAVTWRHALWMVMLFGQIWNLLHEKRVCAVNSWTKVNTCIVPICLHRIWICCITNMREYYFTYMYQYQPYRGKDSHTLLDKCRHFCVKSDAIMLNIGHISAYLGNFTIWTFRSCVKRCAGKRTQYNYCYTSFSCTPVKGIW